MSDTTVTLTGSSPFSGCIEINFCVQYAYSGYADFTKSCANVANGRVLTCNDGYYAIAPNMTQVTLMGDASFTGCHKIDTCMAYGNSGRPAGVESCVQTAVNNRTITCLDGWAVVGYQEKPMIQLIGPEVFTGCFYLDMCALYGTSGLGANTTACVGGLNNRTIFCKPGYHVMSFDHDHISVEVFRDNITITGYDAFEGCTAFCPDGVITPGEECDDGNDVSGDGCSDCKVEAGFVCPDSGEGCCFAGEYYHYLVDQMHLVCRDGWWMSAIIEDDISFAGVNGQKRATNDTMFEIIMDANYLKLCGSVVIEEAMLTVTNNANLIVAGSLYVDNGGVLTVGTAGVMSSINIVEPCPLWPGIPSFRVKELGTLVVIQNSTLIINTDPKNPDLISPIAVTGCAAFEGTFRYEADSIPQNDNYFPLTLSGTWNDCLFTADPDQVETTLPSCPIVTIEVHDNRLVVLTATHRMCAGAIAGTIIGTSAAVGAAVVGAGLLMGAGGSAATVDYVAM